VDIRKRPSGNTTSQNNTPRIARHEGGINAAAIRKRVTARSAVLYCIAVGSAPHAEVTCFRATIAAGGSDVAFARDRCSAERVVQTSHGTTAAHVTAAIPRTPS
jgi:hypothetical protein